MPQRTAGVRRCGAGCTGFLCEQTRDPACQSVVYKAKHDVCAPNLPQFTNVLCQFQPDLFPFRRCKPVPRSCTGTDLARQTSKVSDLQTDREGTGNSRTFQDDRLRLLLAAVHVTAAGSNLASSALPSLADRPVRPASPFCRQSVRSFAGRWRPCWLRRWRRRERRRRERRREW